MKDAGDVLLDFRALLDAAPDGIAVVDDRGRILVVNEQLSHLFGYEGSELIGERVEALVPPRLRPGHEGHRSSYTTSPATRPMGMGLDLLGLRKDGSEFPLEISLSPVKSGGQTFTIAIVRDSTERRHLRAEEQALRTFLDTEQERHRIGMDLHDGIMQDIYAVTLGLELAHEDIDTDPQAGKGRRRALDRPAARRDSRHPQLHLRSATTPVYRRPATGLAGPGPRVPGKLRHPHGSFRTHRDPSD